MNICADGGFFINEIEFVDLAPSLTLLMSDTTELGNALDVMNESTQEALTSLGVDVNGMRSDMRTVNTSLNQLHSAVDRNSNSFEILNKSLRMLIFNSSEQQAQLRELTSLSISNSKIIEECNASMSDLSDVLGLQTTDLMG